VLLVVAVLVAGGVAAFAYHKKMLCFAEEEAGEAAAGDESPLLNEATSVSQLSPSRATSAASPRTAVNKSNSALNRSRPSQSSAVYGSSRT